MLEPMAKLVTVGLSQENRSAFLEPAHHGGIVGGDIVFKNPRSAGGSNTLGHDVVLNGQRNSC